MTKKTIEELCKPLSASVMPRSAYYKMSGGQRMTERDALALQRNPRSGLHIKKIKKPNG